VPDVAVSGLAPDALRVSRVCLYDTRRHYYYYYYYCYYYYYFYQPL